MNLYVRCQNLLQLQACSKVTNLPTENVQFEQLFLTFEEKYFIIWKSKLDPTKPKTLKLF